ncbi:hypothetical protein VN97_g9495 [Penicillium thymicola]|uniref:Uncharacterized protein n=1 Tax=Penicillium thymicola TaxID=293382 RepID=A0AAI9X4Q4_PENTH|nr:hypothetical protein VN97_g9495 [Penicillium thymicola]
MAVVIPRRYISMNTQLTQLHCRHSGLSSFQFCCIGVCVVGSAVGQLLKRSVERGRARRQSKRKVKSHQVNGLYIHGYVVGS